MDDTYAIAQPYTDHFENIYREFNPNGFPSVAAGDAAAFLRRSNVPMTLLGQIWEMADQRRIGALDKRGSFVAFKLIAAAQMGKPINTPGILYDPSVGYPMFSPPQNASAHASPASNVGGQPSPAATQPTSLWAVPQQDQVKYEMIFNSLGSVNGKVPGSAVRPLLLNSGLDGHSLARIWELADQDKDGQLDLVETTIALHLVYRTLQGDPIPAELPQSLIHPSKLMYARRTSNAGSIGVPVYQHRPLFGSRAGSVTSLDEVNMGGSYSATLPKAPAARAVSVQPSDYNYMNGHHNGRTSGCSTPMGSINREVGALTGSVSAGSLSGAGSDWPVTTTHYAAQFIACDTNCDGIVSGADIRAPLLLTGISPQILGHIWVLADVNKNGQLNQEQFALMMFLIEMVKRGEQLPLELPPSFVPPSLRVPMSYLPVQQPEPTAVSQSVVTPQLPEATSMEIKEALECENEEMRQLAESIQSMQIERRKAEDGIAELEADMNAKNAKIKNLQVELTTLESTVKQLERQKTEANRRLSEFDTQIEQLKAACEAQKEKRQETQARMEQIEEDGRFGEESKIKDEDEMQSLRSEIAQLENELSSLNATAAAEQHEREKIVAEEIALDRREARDLAQEERLKAAIAVVNAANDELVKAVEDGSIATFIEQHPQALVNNIDQLLLSDETTYAEASTSNPSQVAHVGGGGQQFNAFPNSHFPVDPFAQADPFASTPAAAPEAFAAAFPADPFAGGFPADAFAAGPAPAVPPPPQNVNKAPPPRPAPPKGSGSARQTPVSDPFGSEAPPVQATNFANFADFGAAFN